MVLTTSWLLVRNETLTMQVIQDHEAEVRELRLEAQNLRERVRELEAGSAESQQLQQELEAVLDELEAAQRRAADLEGMLQQAQQQQPATAQLEADNRGRHRSPSGLVPLRPFASNRAAPAAAQALPNGRLPSSPIWPPHAILCPGPRRRQPSRGDRPRSSRLSWP